MNLKEAYDDYHNLVKIKDAVPNKPYHCKICNATVYACAKTSTAVTPYFRGKHIPGFICADSITPHIESYYGFNLEEFYNSLYTQSDSAKVKRKKSDDDSKKVLPSKFHSVSMLYKCCASSFIEDKINNTQTVGDICVDFRNVKNEWRGFSGLRLFSGYIARFKNDCRTFIITCKSDDKKHYLNAQVSNDESTYEEIKQKISIINPKIAGTEVAIFAKWSKEDELLFEWFGKYIYNISSIINSSNAYYIIR